MAKRVYVLTQLSKDEEQDSVFVLGIYDSLDEAKARMKRAFDYEVFDAEDSGYEPETAFGDRHAMVGRSENWAEVWQIHTQEL